MPKRKIKKKVTVAKIRQAPVFKEMVENGCKTIAKAGRKAGYSEAYIQSGKLQKTKAWQERLEDKLSEELLLEKHNALLNKKEVITKNNNKTGKIEVIRTKEIDVQAVKAGLDMAYKITNKYGETIIRHKFGELSDAELAEELAREISEGA